MCRRAPFFLTSRRAPTYHYRENTYMCKLPNSNITGIWSQSSYTKVRYTYSHENREHKIIRFNKVLTLYRLLIKLRVETSSSKRMKIHVTNSKTSKGKALGFRGTLFISWITPNPDSSTTKIALSRLQSGDSSCKI